VNALAAIVVSAGLFAGSSPFSVEIAFQGPSKLGGCAVGDLDPSRPGEEIAVLASSGDVFLVARSDAGWASRRIFRAPGELIQCAIGDVDPSCPGLELVAVGIAEGGEDDGGSGAAYVLWLDDEGWHGEKVFEDEALLHGVCVLGRAAFVTGYSETVHRITREGDRFRVAKAADLPGAGKSAVPTPLGIVVACTDGSLVVVAPDGEGFVTRAFDRREAGRARLGTGDGRLIACDDDGTLSIVAEGGRTEIHRERTKLRGAVLADLDPASPGLEAATAGYSGWVTVLYPEGDGWKARPIFRDTDRLHHLAAGDLDGSPGDELVTCGFSGRLVVIGALEP